MKIVFYNYYTNYSIVEQMYCTCYLSQVFFFQGGKGGAPPENGLAPPPEVGLDQ